MNTNINPDENLYIMTYSFPCFTGDTLVFTNKGYKKIKDIKCGDMVLTHTNTYQQVIETKETGMNNIYKVKGVGVESIKCTANHRFYVKHEDDLTKAPEWIECDKLTTKHYFGVAINQNAIPNYKDFTVFADALDKDTVPSYMFDMPTKDLKQFFDWYLGKITMITSENKRFIYEMTQLIAKTFETPYSITKEYNDYILDWTEHRENKAFYENGYIWFPITKITNTNTERITYDLTVENDHSFVVYGVIAHNCTDLSLTDKRAG